MARSDLLLALVKASSQGDQARAQAAVEAIIAEERAKRHHVLADRLESVLRANGHRDAARFRSNGRRVHRFLDEVVPRRRLADLVLSDANRRVCRELIEEQHRASVLRANSIEPRHRVLLVGPPGNGKTSLAEAIAEALAVPLLVIRYEGLIGSFLGETATRLKHVFEFARTTPCVLFFDEFDAIGKERGDTHETGEIKRVVSSLLMQTDGLPSYTVVVAASNHAELLDRAAWRRFQIRLSLEPPTPRCLAEYIERFSLSLPEPLGYAPETVAGELGPVSFAEAEEFCRDVRRRQILAMGEIPTREIVRERLGQWRGRAAAHA